MLPVVALVITIIPMPFSHKFSERGVNHWREYHNIRSVVRETVSDLLQWTSNSSTAVSSDHWTSCSIRTVTFIMGKVYGERARFVSYANSNHASQPATYQSVPNSQKVQQNPGLPHHITVGHLWFLNIKLISKDVLSLF